MYKALYLKYRPATFDDMVGQEHVRTVLKRQCESGRISHAYIFCGTRGTGKTTSAKILAKAVNCLSPVNGEPCGKCEACRSIDNGTATDVLELDAASNNKVDDIRTICDELIYPPTSLKKRVYIIDEVHMLTASAYNALLKTLEEPPEHVIFILATTELNKIPPTILSRCQRFEFRRISARDIASRLLYVSEKENLHLTKEGAALIARLADGACRDGFSLLESCVEAADGGEITKEIVANQLGIAEGNMIGRLFDAVSEKNVMKCLMLLDEYYASAKSLSVLLDDMLSVIRDMLFVKQGGKAENLMSNIEEEEILRLSSAFSNEALIYFSKSVFDARNRLTGYAMNKRLITELAIIRLCDAKFSDSNEALAARISALEKAIATGNISTRIQHEAKNEEPQPKPRSEEKHTSVHPSARAEVPFEMVSELCEELGNKPDVKRLLEGSEIYTSGGIMIIRTGNDFAKSILSSPDNAEIIGNSARAVTGKDYIVTVTDLKPKENNNTSYINEIGG